MFAFYERKIATHTTNLCRLPHTCDAQATETNWRWGGDEAVWARDGDGKNNKMLAPEEAIFHLSEHGSTGYGGRRKRLLRIAKGRLQDAGQFNHGEERNCQGGNNLEIFVFIRTMK